MRMAVATISCLSLVLLAGCGTGASERDVAGVVQRFQMAIAAHDGPAACAALTTSTRGKLESQEKQPCPRAVLGLDLRGGGAVTGSDVYVTSAFAEVAGRGAVFLDETRAGWRIAAAGCSPTAPGLPYDCELEG